MRTPRGRAPAAGTAGRRRSSAACTVLARRRNVRFVLSTHLVPKLHPHRRQHPSFRPDLDLVVVPRRPLILAMGFDHRQRNAGELHLAVAPAERAQQVGAPHLEPDEIVRVVDHAHFIGFGVAHPQRGDRRRHQEPTAAPSPRRAARGWRARGPPIPNIALPGDQDVGPGGHDARRGPSCRSRRPPRWAPMLPVAVRAGRARPGP